MTQAGATPPRQLGSYEPLMELAAGGMATVYVARKSGSAGFSRLVVVKRVHPHLLGNREFYDMFRDEARVASLIRHPNVVPVTDVIDLQGELLLVMEYIDSVSLGSLVKEATTRGEVLPYPVVARIVLDALAGLHAAHEAVDMLGNPLHVVHRDVSPQNIIVGADGLSRIIDFGIAQAADRLTDTKTGSLKGKLAYMAPEQAAGSKHVDRRIDVFAAGVTLYESLTSKRLFRGGNDVETLKRILELDVPPPSTIRSELPSAIDEVTLHALARDPDKRYPTARAFHDALEAAVRSASLGAVAQTVRTYAGDRLDQRSQRLRTVLEGSTSAAGIINTPPATLAAAPSSSPAVTANPGEPRSERSGATSASVSLPSAPAPAPAARRSAWFFAGVGGTLLVALGVGVGLLVSKTSAGHGASAPLSLASAEPAPEASATPARETALPAATERVPSNTEELDAAIAPKEAPAASAATKEVVAPSHAIGHTHSTTHSKPPAPKKKPELQANPYK